MTLRDLGLLIGICLVWALNTIVSRIVVADWQIPPLFYAACRFAVVALATLPWLLPAPRPTWRMILIGLLIGFGSFGLFFIGLQTTTPSEAAVIVQLGVPMTTLLSVVLLGETIRWRRGLGIALAFAGVIVVMWDPAGIRLSFGSWLVAASSFMGALGTVLVKKVPDVQPLQFQAWVGFVSLWPLLLCTVLLEQDQVSRALNIGWSFLGAVLFSGLVVSVAAHTRFFGLLRRYDANLIAPLTLVTPLATIAFGILLTGDVFTTRMAVGTVVALLGVLIIALRRNHVAPILPWLRWW